MKNFGGMLCSKKRKFLTFHPAMDNSTKVTMILSIVGMKTGTSWRSRNVFVHTNYSSFNKSNLPRRTTQSVLINRMLSEDKSQSPETKRLLGNLKVDADTFEKSNKLA